MDSVMSKILDNLTKNRFYAVLYLIFMGSLSAGNVIELYNFLITIPVLQWLLNKEVLTVIMYINFNFIFISFSILGNGVQDIVFTKIENRDIIKDTKTIDEIFNSALEIATLTLLNVFIGIVTNRILMNTLVRFIGVIVMLLLISIYSYTYNKYLDYHSKILS